ncbi:dihydroorotate dehydrogenase electron transfer subunit [Congzhengia sp.]|uniref:dihydroorotate dehydrogenase electron transfer subunit n=1 Tax=Congzhengia sp. TaxID=2944168 RepID=UPI003078A00D
MKQEIFEVAGNRNLTDTVFEMLLYGDTSAITAPGQFINIKLNNFFLRRPISVCDCDENGLTIIYKVVGGGTAALANMVPGDEADCLTGLGNGYTLEESGARPLLVGGGVGVPPLFGLCKQLVAQGKQPTVILGFNTKAEIFYENEFRALGAKILVTTADGSYGMKGFVTNAMGGLDYTYCYTCGPEPMLKAVYSAAETGGQFSFEERMGCGFGACMGCSCETKYGAKRICKDGPVLRKEEIVW